MEGLRVQMTQARRAGRAEEHARRADPKGDVEHSRNPQIELIRFFCGGRLLDQEIAQSIYRSSQVTALQEALFG